MVTQEPAISITTGNTAAYLKLDSNKHWRCINKHYKHTRLVKCSQDGNRAQNSALQGKGQRVRSWGQKDPGSSSQRENNTLTGPCMHIISHACMCRSSPSISVWSTAAEPHVQEGCVRANTVTVQGWGRWQIPLWELNKLGWRTVPAMFGLPLGPRGHGWPEEDLHTWNNIWHTFGVEKKNMTTVIH